METLNNISSSAQYPYRSVQIVLRLYSSPAEILAGFDIDAPCCLFDGKLPLQQTSNLVSEIPTGKRVWANPRAIVAMMRQCNTVDMTRRSPSYEIRLAKYSGRAFEVYVPTLRRSDVDPTVNHSTDHSSCMANHYPIDLRTFHRAYRGSCTAPGVGKADGHRYSL
jgi:hypothetical protein